MKSQLVVASDDREMLKRVFRFRYSIYVEEMGFDLPEANHSDRELSDELDQASTTYALLEPSGSILATLRCTILQDLPRPELLISKFKMEPFAERFGIDSLATTSRFMFAPSQRRSSEVLKLVTSAVDLALQRGIRFNFGDTNAIWLEYFERLGYRRYDEPINDPIFGYHLPIVMVVRDIDYLRSAKSPLQRRINAPLDDNQARAWFANRYGHYAELSPIGRTPDTASRTLQGLGIDLSVIHSSPLDSLPIELREEIFQSTSYIRARASDQFTRIGEVDDTIFICLAGKVVATGSDESTVREIGPGYCFATDEFYSRGRRQIKYLAGTDTVLSVLPRRLVYRLRQKYGEVVDEWLQSRA